MTIPTNQTDTINKGFLTFLISDTFFQVSSLVSFTYQPLMLLMFLITDLRFFFSHKINNLHMNPISAFLHTPSQDTLTGGAEHLDTHHIMFTSL